jgi:hypothetical protein
MALSHERVLLNAGEPSALYRAGQLPIASMSPKTARNVQQTTLHIEEVTPGVNSGPGSAKQRFLPHFLFSQKQTNHVKRIVHANKYAWWNQWSPKVIRL